MSNRVTRRCPPAAEATLPEVWLDFDERQKRRLITTLSQPDGSVHELLIQLERVETPLVDGEVLADETGQLAVRVRAKPELLISCSGSQHALTRAAYHLGNRHAKVQITPTAVLTPADPVMAQMLTQLGLEVHEVSAPFLPELGAYHHGHGHGHDHDEAHHHGHGTAKIHRFVMRP